eukprot:908489_1
MSFSERRASVRVVSRVRPFLKKEKTSKCVSILENEIHLTEYPARNKVSTVFQYKFDRCYDEHISQKDIFENEMRSAIKNSLQGVNTSVMGYGMTGSGKTYTIQGSESNPGLITRTVKELLRLRVPEQDNRSMMLNFAYTQIYNDKVDDLLTLKRDLKIRSDEKGRVHVMGMHWEELNDYDAFCRVFRKGCKNRRVGRTNLNEHSSRSHSILVLKVVCRDRKPPFRTTTGKIFLIDLAGSENNRITGNTGVRMKESQQINSSLHVLGKVIEALNKKTAGDHSIRIPHRDCKLTRLLQDSLGGNSCTVIIIHLAPCSSYFQSSYQTLNFGTISKKVVNKPIENVTEMHVVPMESCPSASDQRKLELEKWKRKTGKLTKPERQSFSSSSSSHNQPSSSSNSLLHRRVDDLQMQNVDLQRQIFNIRNSQLSSSAGNSQDSHSGNNVDILKSSKSQSSSDSQCPSEVFLSPPPSKRRNSSRAPCLPTGSTSVRDNALSRKMEIDEIRPRRGILTPNTASQHAKVHITRARALEESGKLDDALRSYRDARECLPSNSKIEKRIRKLIEKQEISKDHPPKKKRRRSTISQECDQKITSDCGKRKLGNNSCHSKSEELLRILNSGSKKDILKLYMIGAKKAEMILAFCRNQQFSSFAIIFADRVKLVIPELLNTSRSILFDSKIYGKS